MADGPTDARPPANSHEAGDRIMALETLAKDLQRRVQDLEAENASRWGSEEQGPPQSIREGNRRKEEAAPSGAQIPPGAVASEPMAPRRDVLSAPHSER